MGEYETMLESITIGLACLTTAVALVGIFSRFISNLVMSV